MHKIAATTFKNPSIARLTNTAALEICGTDALVFLQGQLSQNIASIEQGQSAFAGLSNPKGRLLCVCHVYKFKENGFWVILPITLSENVKTHFTKYIMRSKVSIEIKKDLVLYGAWNNAVLECEHKFIMFEHCDLIIGINNTAISPITLVNESEWHFEKIQQGIPDIVPETQEHFVAQMLNLDRLNGISFDKGCYTGQEIIARMQHLGRIKRRMLLVTIKEAQMPGDKIQLGEKNIGEIVNVSNSGSAHLALAVMQMDQLNKAREQNPEKMEFENFTIMKLPYSLDA